MHRLRVDYDAREIGDRRTKDYISFNRTYSSARVTRPSRLTPNTHLLPSDRNYHYTNKTTENQARA